MGRLQNQSLLLAFSQPEVQEWEPYPETSSAVNSTIILLGVLIFLLQLFLIVFFLLKCWRYETRVREMLKGRTTMQTAWRVPSTLHLSDKHVSYQLYQEEEEPSTTLQLSERPGFCSWQETEPNRPIIHWDLVQF